MITNLRKTQLPTLEASDFYPLTGLLADKLRVIYHALGWGIAMGWLKESHNGIEDILDELINGCLDELRNGKDDARISTAGMTVSLFFDEEDKMELDVYFDVTL